MGGRSRAMKQLTTRSESTSKVLKLGGILLWSEKESESSREIGCDMLASGIRRCRGCSKIVRTATRGKYLTSFCIQHVAPTHAQRDSTKSDPNVVFSRHGMDGDRKRSSPEPVTRVAESEGHNIKMKAS